MLILDPYIMPFPSLVVFGLVFDFLFKFVSSYCVQVQIQIAVVRPPFVKELGTVQRDSLISVGDLSALIYKQLVRVTLVKYYFVLF